MTIIEWYDKYRYLNTSSSKQKRVPVVAPHADRNYKLQRGERDKLRKNQKLKEINGVPYRR